MVEVIRTFLNRLCIYDHWHLQASVAPQELNRIAGVEKTCNLVKVGHIAGQVHVYVVHSFTSKCFCHFISFFCKYFIFILQMGLWSNEL